MFRSIFSLILALAILGHAAKGPNVLVIMSDDQDLHLDSLSVMPNVNSMIGGNGVQYTRHYCTVAWCCPSRVNLLTGRAAHNTNVTGLWAPWGGWPKFASQGLNDNYLPIWLNDSGIRTFYAGKFLNAYGVKNYATPGHPKGWFRNDFLVDPWTYNYFHSHWTNGYTSKITPFKGIHTTNVLHQKALHMLDEAAEKGDQFFMMVAPVAPHLQIGKESAPPPPAKWKGKFSGRKAPRNADFNPADRSGASWVWNLPRLTTKQVASADNIHVHRLENIAAIDEMVASLLDKLKDKNLLDNTYVIYTTDNGFHIGNHRMTPGKRCGYETDINIPLLIRGPDVAKGVISEIVNSHSDIAPTILKMMGVPLRGDFDGEPIAYTPSEISGTSKNEHVNVEFWDNDPRVKPGKMYYDNTYKSLRIQTHGGNFYYSVWCNHEHEFYDMDADPWSMNNKLRKGATGTDKKYFDRPQEQLIHRFDALLMVLKSCKQDTCRNPYKVLFPKGDVSNFGDMMVEKYDKFFANQRKIKFSSCPDGHIVATEGPMDVHVYPKGADAGESSSSKSSKHESSSKTKSSSKKEHSSTKSKSESHKASTSEKSTKSEKKSTKASEAHKTTHKTTESKHKSTETKHKTTEPKRPDSTAYPTEPPFTSAFAPYVR